MTPLEVTASLSGPVVLPSGGLALDALLMAAACIRDRIPSPTVQLAQHGRLVEIVIPVAQERGIYLATVARPRFDQHETRYTNRRFPIVEALHHSAMRRVNTSAGAQKSYRLPYSASYAEGDRLTWWCTGDEDGVRALLSLVHGLGKRRGVGNGAVRGWRIERCDPWPGFPVLRDGLPLRPLPPDWPGLAIPVNGYAVLSPPYWDHAREEPAAVPV